MSVVCLCLVFPRVSWFTLKLRIFYAAAVEIIPFLLSRSDFGKVTIEDLILSLRRFDVNQNVSQFGDFFS